MDIWSNAIAVIGTLSGGGLTAVIQSRLARATRRDERAEKRREEQIKAVQDLAATLADHRTAMWLREHERLHGDAAKYDALREESHDTRSAITAPLTAVEILAPDLADAAKRAAQAAYDLRDAPDTEILDILRGAAIREHGRFVAEAGRHLGTPTK